MKVREVMTRKTVFCGLETTLAEAAELMSRNQCGFLPVVGEGGNVIAVITDRDICVALGTRNRKASSMLVQEVVLPREFTFPKLFACTPDDDIHCILKTMRAEKIRRLPVIDPNGVLQGVLSLDDIVLRACQYAGKHDISCGDVVATLKAICGDRQARPLAA